MCNKNLRPESQIKVNRLLEFFKYGNFDFVFFGGEEVDSYLKSDF